MSDEQKLTSSPVNNQQKQNSSTTQNPFLGIGAGVGAMIVGTALWVLIVQKFQMTWMSVAIAFGIASAIKYAGKAKDMWYGFVSAALSLLAAFIGNYATVVFLYARKYDKTPIEAFSTMGFGEAAIYMKYLAGFVGIILYIATIYVGFWFAYEHPKKKSMVPDDL